MTRSIDLNADMGEYANDAQRAVEQALMPLVTSCSIACGGHAGDEETMRTTIRLAKKHGVGVGAHPSYPDRDGFGRRSLEYDPQELEQSLSAQIAALKNIADEANASLRHVKPHGALYNDATKRPELARVIVEAVRAVDTELVLLGPPASAPERAAQDAGLAFAAEGFVDRLYRKDGSLTPRGAPGAIIKDVKARAEQAVTIAAGGRVKTPEGEIALQVKTLCIHSDSPGAVETARAVRAALADNDIVLKAFS